MSTTYTQQGRWLQIATPLGEDELLIRAFTGTEEISHLFQFDLEMISVNDAIDAKKLIGQNVSLTLTDLDGTQRFFNGYISKFSYRGTDDRLSLYYAQVVPWVWFLTQTRDCRIFQNKTIPQIIQAVFAGHRLPDYETAMLRGPHPVWEYCVQYRESDFDFISRLMEQEGIYYYFRHEQKRHVLILADHKTGYKDCDENQLSLADNASGGDSDDKLIAWEHNYAYRPSKVTHTDYNFKKPSASLLATVDTVVALNAAPKTEIYDYPGQYTEKSIGTDEVRIRMEETEASFDTVTGKSKCRSFSPGHRFTLTRHHSENETGKRYVLTIVHHHARQSGGFVSGGKADENDYHNTFTCIPADVPFRPERNTPKPLVKGIQTATVVGPSGEEIYTDEFGRIKVQFHWDRDGKRNESSSCWIRVAQAWAGAKWGALFLPRVGQEVIVSFLEGDPDRPLVTGSVYNAEQMPPYTLPDNQTMSTTKSLSSKGGNGFNEIRFEDKKGQEQIFVHAEKNQDIEVKNDRMETIRHDRSLIVKNDKMELVEGDRHEEIKKCHVELIGKDRNLEVRGNQTTKIDGTYSRTVKGDVIETVAASQSIEITKDLYMKGKNIVIEATENLTIKVGNSFIAIDKTGISLGTSGTIDADAPAGLKLQSSAKAEISSPMTTVKGDAIMVVQGGIVKIN